MRIPSRAEPTLEGLPTELVILILLYIPDHASLRSMVHSSSVYHQAYRAASLKVLYRVLRTQYEPLLDPVEAITAVRSEGIIFKTHKEEYIALLDIWRRRNEIRELSRNLKLPSQIDKPGSVEERIKLTHFYQMLHCFLQDFMKNIPRPAWMQPAESHDKIVPMELSFTDKWRFVRALC
jgi:hypothetical protein